jgi:hypothetical protein
LKLFIIQYAIYVPAAAATAGPSSIGKPAAQLVCTAAARLVDPS